MTAPTRGRGRPAGPPSRVVGLQMPEELLALVEEERLRMAEGRPGGVVSQAEAIRELVWDGLRKRRRTK